MEILPELIFYPCKCPIGFAWIGRSSAASTTRRKEWGMTDKLPITTCCECPLAVSDYVEGDEGDKAAHVLGYLKCSILNKIVAVHREIWSKAGSKILRRAFCST